MWIKSCDCRNIFFFNVYPQYPVFCNLKGQNRRKANRFLSFIYKCAGSSLQGQKSKLQHVVKEINTQTILFESFNTKVNNSVLQTITHLPREQNTNDFKIVTLGGRVEKILMRGEKNEAEIQNQSVCDRVMTQPRYNMTAKESKPFTLKELSEYFFNTIASIMTATILLQQMIPKAAVLEKFELPRKYPKYPELTAMPQQMPQSTRVVSQGSWGMGKIQSADDRTNGIDNISPNAKSTCVT